MKKNTYGIFGMVEQSCLIPIGSGHLRVNFAKGSLSSNGVTPATFVTTNAVVQSAIENSDKYKNGIIKLVRSVSLSVEDDGDTVTKSSGSLKVYQDVKNSNQAKEILMSTPYDVSLADLGSKSAVQKKAEELGVSFPNWK